MSAEENVEKTKRAYAAFAAADVDGASENMADDIEWVVPGNSAISGTYRGKDEVIGFWMELAGKEFTTEPEHFLSNDEDMVVVLTKITAGGQTADQADALTFRDGKVVKFQSAGDTAMQEQVWGSK